MKISLMMLTLDRSEITIATFKKNIYTIMTDLKSVPGAEVEVLIADNGSKESAVRDYFRSWKPAYYRQNSVNEGVNKAFNQLYLRSTGDYIVFLGNDIELPPGWILECLKFAQNVPNTGLIGIDWGHSSLPPLDTKNGFSAHWVTIEKDKVFGTWFVRRAVIDAIGLFHEGYGPYGIEDSDFNVRVTLAGFQSLYIPNLKSKHLCHDWGNGTDYRKMKDESLAKNSALFDERVKRFDLAGIIEPLPEKKDPL